MGGAAVGIIKLAKQPPKAPAADDTPVRNGPTPSSQATGFNAPNTSFAPAATVAAPFLGTPAQSYANGAVGIVIPPAHPVGIYSAAQVAAAYRITKKMLIAANLNGPTLAGQAPNAFAKLLIPQQRSFFVDRLDNTGVTSKGVLRSTRYWVTSFAPGTTQLVGNVIKVHGTMRASAGKNGSYNVVQITADYLFVYAVERPDQPSTLMRVVVRDVVDNEVATYGDPGGALEPWWVSGGAVSGELCGINDGFVHPDFPSGPPGKVRPTGAPVNPYDQSTPLPAGGGCRAVQRT